MISPSGREIVSGWGRHPAVNGIGMPVVALSIRHPPGGLHGDIAKHAVGQLAMACAARASSMNPSATSACCRAPAESCGDAARAAKASIASDGMQPPREREPSGRPIEADRAAQDPRPARNRAAPSSPDAADAERFEVPAIRAVVCSGELQKDFATVLQRSAAQRQRDLAPHRGRSILRQAARLARARTPSPCAARGTR